MTTDEFNALPEAARRFITSQQKCLSCGKKNNLDEHYKKYLIMKNSALFTLRNGAISFLDEKTKKSQILYPLHPSDSDKEIKEKLKIALRINKVRPNSFSTISVEEIEAILKVKAPAPAVEETTAPAVEETQAPAVEETAAPTIDENDPLL